MSEEQISEEQNGQSNFQPLIGSEQRLPEITIKAVVISIFLIVILAASNAYLGLKVGTTISASIPAVVISMGIFRLFRQHNVLEINIAQTAASVGEGITAGIIFTVPALIIMHFWGDFNYWETALIGITGGILGVLFSIPLKRALFHDRTLRFPEGTAIGQVMKVSASGGTSLKYIISGGIVSALIGLLQTGFRMLAQEYEGWIIKSKMVMGFGLGFSPAVLAAGYICGVNVGISILVGVLIGWIFGIPLISAHYGIPHGLLAEDAAQQIWLDYVRYIGVGTMLVGGLWTLITLFKPVAKAITTSWQALHARRRGEAPEILRTEHDIPINIIFWSVLFIAAIFFVELFNLFKPDVLGISMSLNTVLILMCMIYLISAGFVFSSVSGYFAGLVGATNSPGSGLLVAALLILSLLLLLILSPFIHFDLNAHANLAAAALAVMVCSFIGTTTVMTNEAVQDFKAGQIVGATPWKQQMILIFSVIVASLVVPLILHLLFDAYGIGGVFPHAGMSHSQMLSAPQAALMSALAQGVFSHQLPWAMVVIGAIVAVVGIIIDEFLKFFWGMRLPVLAVGLGIYLPISASVPIIIGGFLSYLVQRRVHAKYGLIAEDDGNIHVSSGMQKALLLACGIVAGETIMGVVLAIPFAIKQSADALRIMPERFMPIAGAGSILVTLLLCYWIYHVAMQKK